MSTRTCPVCQKTLEPMVFHSVHADVCPGECGVWFDRGELDTVRASDSRENIDAAFAGTYRPSSRQETRDALNGGSAYHCPVDATPMTRYEWNQGSGLVFDRCETCAGKWLDAGELEGFATFIERFNEKPPELSPEVYKQLQSVEADVERKYDEHKEEAIDTVLSGTVFGKLFKGNLKGLIILDDLMRLMMR